MPISPTAGNARLLPALSSTSLWALPSAEENQCLRPVPFLCWAHTQGLVNMDYEDHSPWGVRRGHQPLSSEESTELCALRAPLTSPDSAQSCCSPEALHCVFSVHKSVTHRLFPRKPELQYGVRHSSLPFAATSVNFHISEQFPEICPTLTVESVNILRCNKYQDYFHTHQNGNILLIFKGAS